MNKNSTDRLINWFLDEAPQAMAEMHSFLSVIKSMGIVAAYHHLDASEITPEACLKNVSHSLDLLAFHGDKWLFEQWFEPELERLRLRNGHVRLLLSNTITSHTIERCQELIKRYPKVLAVRTFTEAAVFRVVIMDDARLLLGHYGYDMIEQDGSNAKGWKSPHLLIEDNKNWSFFIPFRQMFINSWDVAKNISDELLDKSVIKRDFHPIKRNE